MNKSKTINRMIPVALLFAVSAIPQFAGAYSSEANKLLAQVRAATAKYHDVAVAEAAGYTGAGEPCVPEMGYHYINFGFAFQPGVTELQPEVLLYVDTPNGGKRLVGVEYIDFATDIDGNVYVGPPATAPTFTSPRPKLFDGQLFDEWILGGGPMPGHAAGMPWHYDLHVWIWSHNPDGTFATFNPNVTCPQ